MITAVPIGPDLIWMDSTAEVAPFRLLSSPLRDKSALLVQSDGVGKIVETPVDPPFLSTQLVEIDCAGERPRQTYREAALFPSRR